jgi:integrase
MPWDTWSGGRVWIGLDGRKTYYVRVDGRYVSTRERSEDGAFAWMVRKQVGGLVATPPLNDLWIAEYTEHCKSIGMDRTSVLTKQRQLWEWKERVGFRRATLPVLAEISKTLTGARNKVSALKAYFTWLRQQGRVQRQHDPTPDLAKPRCKPTDWDRLVPIEHHRKVVAWMNENGRGRWADLLTVLLATGWHVSELLRFVRSGSIDGDVLACPRHKSGEPHRTRVSEAALEAAGRSREAGTFSLGLFYRQVAEACDAVKVPRFGIGGYRHTVATAAIRAGATPEEVAFFLGHKGAYMVKQIYAKVAVPKKIPTLA